MLDNISSTNDDEVQVPRESFIPLLIVFLGRA